MLFSLEAKELDSSSGEIYIKNFRYKTKLLNYTPLSLSRARHSKLETRLKENETLEIHIKKRIDSISVIFPTNVDLIYGYEKSEA